MPETCPYLEYRDLPDSSAGEPRAYCTAADQFVQPMRADICNDRYDLSHETDCEIYRAHEGLGGEGRNETKDGVPEDDEREGESASAEATAEDDGGE